MQQKALTRKKISQNGIENFALDNEGDEHLSASVIQENQVLRHNGLQPARSNRGRSEAKLSSNASCHQEQQDHVYQRVESCVFDPPVQDYQEILETQGHRQSNQHPATRASVKSPKLSSYRSASPQLQAVTESHVNKNDQEDGNFYQKLIIRDGLPDKGQAFSVEQASTENGNTSARESIPDYVEIISDEIFAEITMKKTTSQAEIVDDNNAYETLKPTPGPTVEDKSKESTCAAVTEAQQSVRAEDMEGEDYLELLKENEAGGTENAPADKNTYEQMGGESTSSSQTN